MTKRVTKKEREALKKEREALKKAATAAKEFVEAIRRDIPYVYSPVAAERLSSIADQVLTQLAAALAEKG